MKIAFLLLALQTVNLMFFYGFFIAGKFSEFCCQEQNVANAKRLGRYEKKLATLVAAHPKRGMYGFLLCARLAHLYPDLISIMARSRAQCVPSDTRAPTDVPKNPTKAPYDYL